MKYGINLDTSLCLLKIIYYEIVIDKNSFLQSVSVAATGRTRKKVNCKL